MSSGGARDRSRAAPVYGRDGSSIGVVSGVAVGGDGGAADWLLIEVGGARVPVPAAAASTDGSGSVRLPFVGEELLAAPRPAGNVISAAEAAALLAHYGMA